MRRLPGFVFVLVLLGLAPSAMSFQVRPVRLELGSRVSASQLVVHNPTQHTLLLQAEAFDWNQEHSKDRLQPTQALILNPPIFELPPGASQVLRVGLRKPAQAGVEQSHRIWLSQVPTPQEGNGGVQMLLRVSLPVFVTGAATPPAQPSWQRQGHTLALHNSGGRYLQVRAMQLLSDQGETASFGPCYALPGQQCRWDLPPGWTGAGTRCDADTSVGPQRGRFDAAAAP